MVYSGIPLAVGLVFLLAAILSFLKIESRSLIHFILLVFVVAFGMLTLQGLSGIALHLAHVSPQHV
jgi:hypothetical protein